MANGRTWRISDLKYYADERFLRDVQKGLEGIRQGSAGHTSTSGIYSSSIKKLHNQGKSINIGGKTVSKSYIDRVYNKLTYDLSHDTLEIDELQRIIGSAKQDSAIYDEALIVHKIAKELVDSSKHIISEQTKLQKDSPFKTALAKYSDSIHDKLLGNTPDPKRRGGYLSKLNQEPEIKNIAQNLLKETVQSRQVNLKPNPSGARGTKVSELQKQLAAVKANTALAPDIQDIQIKDIIARINALSLNSDDISDYIIEGTQYAQGNVPSADIVGKWVAGGKPPVKTTPKPKTVATTLDDFMTPARIASGGFVSSRSPFGGGSYYAPGAGASGSSYVVPSPVPYPTPLAPMTERESGALPTHRLPKERKPSDSFYESPLGDMSFAGFMAGAYPLHIGGPTAERESGTLPTHYLPKEKRPVDDFYSLDTGGINLTGFIQSNGQNTGLTMPVEKTWSERLGDSLSKSLPVIAKALPALAKPLMNVAKTMGAMAADAGKAGSEAFSAAAALMGNPLDAATLDGIASMGGAIGGMSGSTISNIGGVISGAGEGMGRLANGSVAGGGAANVADGDAGAKVGKMGKLAGAAGIVSAGLGVAGSFISAGGQAVSGGWNTAVSLLKSINKATLKIMATSPLFETIKNILNLAYTMVFLPAMTLLQSEMMPAFTKLLDWAVKFGAEFAETFSKYVAPLTNLFEGVIANVMNFFDSHKEDLASMVSGMITLIPAMMELQMGFIELFVNNKDKILDLCTLVIHAMENVFTDKVFDALLNMATLAADLIDKYGESMARLSIAMATWLLDEVAEPLMRGLDTLLKIYDMISAFLRGDFGGAASAAKDVATNIFNNIASGDILGAASNTIVKGVGGVAKAVGGLFHFATGGYVPAVPGGVPAIIGEGGEGEYIIPESKMGGIGGGITINFSGPVYGMNDFKQQVRGIMNEYSTKANFR